MMLCFGIPYGYENNVMVRHLLLNRRTLLLGDMLYLIQIFDPLFDL